MSVPTLEVSTACEPAVCVQPTDVHTMCCVLRPLVVSVARFARSLASRASVVACVGCRAELFSLPCAWMASSSDGHGAASAPPPPDRLAVFYKLVDEKVIASVLCRYARAEELAAEAAMQAEALFTDNSLVVAKLRMDSSKNLTNIVGLAGGGQEALRQSWALLLSMIPILLRRLESNTLLPGTIRDEELDFEAHELAVILKAKNNPVPRPAALRAAASVMGYTILLEAMTRGFDLLWCPWFSAVQKRCVELFVLQGLDVIPRTAGVALTSACECRVVAMIEMHMNPRDYDPAFYAAVLRKWRSDAVRGVLRARGALQNGVADAEQEYSEFEARKSADVVQHGLRDCALPSCSKTEKTVKEFAGCSGCRTVVYCCLEHQALDWRAHKKACREEAARLAEEEAERETGGGAAAS